MHKKYTMTNLGLSVECKISVTLEKQFMEFITLKEKIEKNGVTSRDAEKVFAISQHPFIMKLLSKQE